ncbi:hypothetical protein AAHA92_15849 [Salvia divinorum]|uniref:Glycine-rich protein n=1 Tax=Salvia divinorum TaxID=28513 RepID=A0ABD1GU36_SALDI
MAPSKVIGSISIFIFVLLFSSQVVTSVNPLNDVKYGGGGYGGGGGGGGYGGGGGGYGNGGGYGRGGGGYCYHGCCRCCNYAGEKADAQP